MTVKITGDSRSTSSPAAIGVTATKPLPDPSIAMVSTATISVMRSAVTCFPSQVLHMLGRSSSFVAKFAVHVVHMHGISTSTVSYSL